MNRTLTCAVLAATTAAMLLSGCTAHDAPPKAGNARTTTQAPAPSPSPSDTKGADPWLLSAAGIGPYRIGEKPSADLLANGQPDAAGCPDTMRYDATGAYAGTLLLLVSHGLLVEIETAGGEAVRTATGAQLGDTVEHVQALYGAKARITRGEGGIRGVVVPVGANSMIFAEGPPQRQGVGLITVGRSPVVLNRFAEPRGCV